MFFHVIYIFSLTALMIFGAPSPTVKVMSFNIRYDNPGDGEHRWELRRTRVANIIKFYQPQIFGLQEALHRQVTFIEEQFPDYQRVGVGRDDGAEEGEFSPIFFDNTVFKSIGHGTFWLSNTPDKPSKDWDAALPRIASWVLLQHIESNDTLLFCNTHFDHRGEVAREESAKLLVNKLPELAKGYPIILVGDFNSNPKSKPYQAIATSESLHNAKEKSVSPPIGPTRTFSGFEVSNDSTGEPIDHIFVSQDIEVMRFATINEEQQGAYASDHFPVFAEISWAP